MQIHNLAGILRKNALFAALGEEQFGDLGKCFSVESFSLGDAIVRRGDPGDGFFTIYAGRARVVDDSGGGDPVTVAVLNKGDSFGEQALLYNTPRAFTVRAASDMVALKLSNRDFEEFTRRHPQLREMLDEKSRQDKEFNFLRRLTILAHLKLPEIQALLGSIERISLRAGEVLFEEGQDGDRAYIIRDGHLRIQKRTDGDMKQGRVKQLAIAKPGDLIGEMSLLYGHPRSATAIAASDAIVMALSQEVFRDVIGEAEARDVLLQQATDRILQAETLLAEPEPGTEQGGEKQRLIVEHVQLDRGFWARPYPFVRTANPLLAGLACMTMVNTVLGRPSPSDAEIERQLRQTQADTLLSLSRKAEESGVMSRLLRLDAAQLREIQLPAVAETRDGDLVVLLAASRRRVVVANPLTGIRTLPPEEFAADWNGSAMTVLPIPQASFDSKTAGAIYRQYLPFAKPFFPLVVWIGVMSLTSSLLGLAQPFFQKTIVDNVLVNRDRALLNLLLLGMLLVTGFQLAAGSLRQYLVTHVLRRISGLLLLRFFHHILSLPQRIASKWQAGDFLIRMAENEKVLQLAAETGLGVILDSLMVIIYVGILFSMNAQLAAASLGFVLGYGGLMLWSSPRLRSAERQVFQARKECESHMVEAISGIQTIKALAIEDHLLESGGALMSTQKVREFKAAKLNFTIGQFGSLLQQAPVIVVLGFGAKLALEQKITTGELVAFNTLLGSTLAPLMNLVKVWDQIQELRIAFERTTDVLKLEAEQNPKTALTPAIQGHVLFKNVCFRYPDSPSDVLSDLNLEVLPGQKIAIVGRSGSGKTSLANLLVSLYEPTGGALLVDHMDVSAIHKQVLRRQVGIVEQQPFLFSGTIRENIAKADPAAGLDNVVAAATLAGAHEFIEDLPLAYDTQIGERGMTLSGGQKQRLVIARALLNRPRILILDEATSALDTESERIIQKNMERILEGKTAFIIAHRLSTVRNADKIVVLDQGKIVEAGTHTELMEQQGLYAYLNTSSS
jgi:ATP-binding cassette subfamily B protein